MIVPGSTADWVQASTLVLAATAATVGFARTVREERAVQRVRVDAGPVARRPAEAERPRRAA